MQIPITSREETLQLGVNTGCSLLFNLPSDGVSACGGGGKRRLRRAEIRALVVGVGAGGPIYLWLRGL